MTAGADRERASAVVADGLRALDVRELTLVVHDASFPAEDDEDVGRGAPGTRGALRFLRFVRELGFTGVQLGPDGQTPPDDPSPYRSAALPKNPLSIALAPLAEDAAWGGVLTAEALRAAVRARPVGAREHVAYAAARAAHETALRAAFKTFATGASHAMATLRGAAQRFERENASWLDRYELFEPLAVEHGTRDPRRWPAGDRDLWCDGDETRQRALRGAHAPSIAFFRFAQFVADAQRRRFASSAREIGLRLFADLPIGLAPEDVCAIAGSFLDDWRMGAPPSRTNPDGQAWDYPVFDPRRYRGPVLRFLDDRLDRVFAGADGLRIDHPHGLVCPWVYDAHDPDPGRAVQAGGRLFESPDRPDLAAFALVDEDQLATSEPRHADGWVTRLTPAQEDAYAFLIDAVLAAARRHGHDVGAIACEVLSTLPLPSLA